MILFSKGLLTRAGNLCSVCQLHWGGLALHLVEEMAGNKSGNEIFCYYTYVQYLLGIFWRF